MREHKIKTMKAFLIGFLFFWGLGAMAQQSIYRLPRDAANNQLYFGLGASYSGTVSVAITSYGTGAKVQLPSTGSDTNRAYRHLMIKNPDASLSIYICLDDSSITCATDAMIVRPGYTYIFEPLLFGKSVGKEFIYFKLSSGGTVSADYSVW